MAWRNSNRFGEQTFKNLVCLADNRIQHESVRRSLSLKQTVELIEVLLDEEISPNASISELSQYAQRALDTLEYCKKDIAKIRGQYK